MEKEPTPQDIQKAKLKILTDAHAGFWAQFHEIKLPDGQFTFKNREYLIDVFSDQTRVQVNQKATQGGSSVSEVLIDLHGCIKGKYPKGVAIAMPTAVDVQKFAKTKWDLIIRNNYVAIGKYTRQSRKDVDSADLKKVGHSFIHFVGTTLSKNIQGEMESSTLRSFSVDKIVCDELDLMPQSVIEKLQGRYTDSEIQEERYISNPTAENYGINALFNKSDQKYWNRLCPHCLKWTSAELEFLKNPEGIIRRTTDTSGYLVCAHCGKGPLPLYYFDTKSGKRSQWIPLYKGREISGRLWGQLNSTKSDPVRLLNLFLEPPNGNLKDIMRYRLGFAYTSKEDQLRPSDVYECCDNNEPFATSSAGPCAMGVDVGIVKHIVIGEKIGKDRYRMIYVGTRLTWNEINDLARKYNVRCAGIDIAPDIDAAKQFQNSQRYPVWLCDYKSSRHISDWDYDDKSKIAKINRTEIFDTTHRIFVEKLISLPRRELLDEFITQICNPFKMEFKNEKTGIPEYRYIGFNDHYRNALNYFMVAAKKIARIKDSTFFKQKTPDCIMNYSSV